jgi:hypothetical protein
MFKLLNLQSHTLYNLNTLKFSVKAVFEKGVLNDIKSIWTVHALSQLLFEVYTKYEFKISVHRSDNLRTLHRSADLPEQHFALWGFGLARGRGRNHLDGSG